MAEATMSDTAARAVRSAERLVDHGDYREAVDLLTQANRESRDTRIERALVRFRRDGGKALPHPETPAPRAALAADQPDGELFEVHAHEMTESALRAGLARSGCLLVRELVPPARVAQLAAGIDSALGAYDTSLEDPDTPVDAGWYTPFTVPARQPGVSEEVRRRFNRRTGGLWTANSPRMLYELFELVDDVGIGALMTENLGERPLLS